MIGSLQNEIAQNDILRAGKHWRENGEKSAGYLKRSITSRAVKRNIESFLHPVTSEICTSTPDLQSAACAFYSDLYTPTDIDNDSVDILCSSIPESSLLTASSHPALLKKFDILDIISGANRSPRHSSSGTDGIPYEILSILLNHPETADTAVKVYNDALLRSVFPLSWNKTSMALLPKKGDLANHRNWRPISLITTDAKVFTRLLNARLMPFVSKCISSTQLGFMPGRFIAENGQMVNIIQLIATKQQSSTIGLLLDQEKAYDRVHPDYLRTVMLKLGIPSQVVSSLNLFSKSVVFFRVTH